jgi:hypothetical protein
VISADTGSIEFTNKLQELDSALSGLNGKIDVMVLIGQSEQVEDVLHKTFEAEPFYRSKDVQMFRRLR